MQIVQTLDIKTLPPPSNLAGQLSRGAKKTTKDLPSLVVGPDEEVDMNQYDARKLAQQVCNDHKANILRKGD